MTMPKSQYARHVHHHWYGFVMVCCYWKLLTHKTAPNMGIMGKFIGSLPFCQHPKNCHLQKMFQDGPQRLPQESISWRRPPHLKSPQRHWSASKNSKGMAQTAHKLFDWGTKELQKVTKKKLKILKTINFWEDNLVNNLGPQLPLASSSI